ncbi:MAG: hypothetical protein V3R76_00290 [Gammaproteobacteria bacterium]
MKLDKNRSYGRIKSLDPKNKIAFTQDGIDYDSAGDPLNQKQVKKYLDGLAESIQSEADKAMEIAKAAQVQAKERLAELKDKK